MTSTKHCSDGYAAGEEISFRLYWSKVECNLHELDPGCDHVGKETVENLFRTFLCFRCGCGRLCRNESLALAGVSMTCEASKVPCTQNDSCHGSSPRLCAPHVKPLVSSAGLEVAVCHFGHHLLFFSRYPDLLPGTVGLARRVDPVLLCGFVGCFRFNVLAFRG